MMLTFLQHPRVFCLHCFDENSKALSDANSSVSFLAVGKTWANWRNQGRQGGVCFAVSRIIINTGKGEDMPAKGRFKTLSVESIERIDDKKLSKREKEEDDKWLEYEGFSAIGLAPLKYMYLSSPN
ncbi:hypothetical protein OIU76_007243 [Salix suchowensis]|nr:hypothetical protein OIU76_007243 [Salix suchowensis]